MVKRILAGLTILIIVGLIIGMVVSAITGNGYFLGLLFATMVFPVIVYVIVWIRKLIEKYHVDPDKEQKKDQI